MSIQTIYAQLVNAGMSPVGACAMMGNMQAESSMRADNVQDGMGYGDADYTAAVDAGAIDFVGDQRGYGLCQWTYPARKRNLLEFARARGVSVGNETMQVDFCIKELQTEYAGLWQYLCSATGVYEAASRICKEYERPAVNNVDVRAQFANQFYMTLGSMEVTIPQSPAVTAPFTQESLGAPDNAPTGEPEDAIFHTPAGSLPEIFWPPRVLAYGMFGGDVVALQGLMIAHGYPAGITGRFDQATYDQLRAFQQARGLTADSIAGNETWTALCRR